VRPPRGLAWGVLLLGVWACGAEVPQGAAGDGAGAPALTFDPARVPDSAPVAGVPMVLDAHAWLDHRPAAAQVEGDVAGPMHLSLRVAPKGAVAMPDGLTVDRVWVIGGDHTWEAPLDRLVLKDGRLEGRVGGGPPLDPGLPADVVVRVVGPDDQVGFLKVRLAGVPTLD